jgi:hypothetical protein
MESSVFENPLPLSLTKICWETQFYRLLRARAYFANSPSLRQAQYSVMLRACAVRA